MEDEKKQQLPEENDYWNDHNSRDKITEKSEPLPRTL